MKAKIQPYLFFGGRCEEALEFYWKALGAETEMLMRFKDSPEEGMEIPDGYEEKVMHGEVRVGESVFLVSDGCGEVGKFEGFGLSITFATEAEVGKAFEELSVGGKVEMPVGKTFWSPCFGMVTDKYGVSWMLGVEDQEG